MIRALRQTDAYWPLILNEDVLRFLDLTDGLLDESIESLEYKLYLIKITILQKIHENCTRYIQNYQYKLEQKNRLFEFELQI
uniref:Uncharacterized protein n=1 Tax=viral metagenome TaxID=1070528 RepID=A0A6C0I9L6_9ZZZZ